MSSILHVFLLWSPYVIGQTITFSSCFFLSSSFFISSPNLSSQRLDVYHTSTHGVANLECRSEMCCMWLAENTGRKNGAKNRHLGTIPQLCRAISSQLRHVSTIGKKNLLSSNISSTYAHNMGTPATFNGFRVLAALLHGM